VDWRIADQSLRFAITGDGMNNALGIWSASIGGSEPVFDDLFTSEHPAFIKDGAPSIVIWLSFTILRNQADSLWEGTVMLPGLYFVHDPEDTSTALAIAGSTAENTQTRHQKRAVRVGPARAIAPGHSGASIDHGHDEAWVAHPSRCTVRQSFGRVCPVGCSAWRNR
jgi:hypothetical protein